VGGAIDTAKRPVGLSEPSLPLVESGKECNMAGKSKPDDAAAAKQHNHLARQIVSQSLTDAIEAGGTTSDVVTPCESVMVGGMLGCFQPGSDVKVLDLIVGRVAERLAKVGLEDLETKGSG
jgi:hypothetical protein